jgi:FkbM family methyltransferase
MTSMELKSAVKTQIKKGLTAIGVWDLLRYKCGISGLLPPFRTKPALPDRRQMHRRISLLRAFEIDAILDVGANEGQFAQEMRSEGFVGRIVSFEPLATSYRHLRGYAQFDPLWDVVQLALGDFDGQADLNVSRNSQSSSILDMSPRLRAMGADIEYCGTQTVEVRRLDSVWDLYRGNARRVYLKLDVQGAEAAVLRGAEKSLPEVVGVHMETSLEELYEGGELLVPTLIGMEKRGFKLMGIEPEFSDATTGQLLQADCLFFRPEFLGVSSSTRRRSAT